MLYIGVLLYVQHISSIERLALSVIPARVDAATLRSQGPPRHTASNEDATTMV